MVVRSIFSLFCIARLVVFFFQAAPTAPLPGRFERAPMESRFRFIVVGCLQRLGSAAGVCSTLFVMSLDGGRARGAAPIWFSYKLLHHIVLTRISACVT